MTRNHDQIAHCTMTSDRAQAYPEPRGGKLPLDGFRRDVMQYLWPGAIVQTVENAINGEPFIDPEAHLAYNIQDFEGSASGAIIVGGWRIIPPMVVKPDPFVETEALRTRLHKVADDALAHVGKLHYRLYAYIDASIINTEQAGTDAGWAAGTRPGMCSAFIWQMMKRNGFHLQGPGEFAKPSDLTPAQVKAGARIGPATLDGLYYYEAAETRHAGQWLHDNIYNLAFDLLKQKACIAAGAIEFLTRISDKVSDQTCNAFAINNPSPDSDAWKDVGAGNSVSPDNIMLWNSPSAATPGPYGYGEPLIYREPRYDRVTVHRSRKAHATGTLQGCVVFQENPIKGVIVSLYDGKSATTNASELYVLEDVPYGSYIAKAQLVRKDGSYLSASPSVSMNAPNVALDIALSVPPAQFRRAKVDAVFRLHHARYLIVRVGEESRSLPFHEELDVSPNVQAVGKLRANNVGDVHAGLMIVVDGQADKSMKVTFLLRLNEQKMAPSSIVPEDGRLSNALILCDPNGRDDVRVDFAVKNERK